MLIRCQSCGATASLDVLIEDTAAAQALTLALKLSSTGRAVIKYLGLFRPEKRALSMARVAVILGELNPMIEAGRIERNGTVYSVSPIIWERSLEKVVQMRDLGKLATPLKSHGYLLEIIVTELAKSVADKVARGEAKKDAEKQAGLKNLEQAQQAQVERDAPKVHVPVPIPSEWKAQFSELLKNAATAAPLTAEQKTAQLARLKSLTTSISAEDQAKLDKFRAERGEFALEM
jgi:hypothetical protein